MAGTNIYVGNLADSTTSRDLEELFARHGQLDRAQVMTDRDTGRSRGFGFVEMSSADEAAKVELVKGPNIASLPDLDPLPDRLDLPVLLKVGDDISTDEILRAGAEVLPYRSNIPRIAEFTYDIVDATYPKRAAEERDHGYGGHVIVGGTNYGQGSSREHAAIAPRYLGLRVVLARQYARIHWQNLANFGVLALEFVDPADWDRLQEGDVLTFDGLHALVDTGTDAEVQVDNQGPVHVRHHLSPRQRAYVRAGGITNWMRDKEQP